MQLMKAPLPCSWYPQERGKDVESQKKEGHISGVGGVSCRNVSTGDLWKLEDRRKAVPGVYRDRTLVTLRLKSPLRLLTLTKVKGYKLHMGLSHPLCGHLLWQD